MTHYQKTSESRSGGLASPLAYFLGERKMESKNSIRLRMVSEIVFEMLDNNDIKPEEVEHIITHMKVLIRKNIE